MGECWAGVKTDLSCNSSSVTLTPLKQTEFFISDSEQYWTGSFTGKILTRQKMASNNVINTELVGSIVCG